MNLPAPRILSRAWGWRRSRRTRRTSYWPPPGISTCGDAIAAASMHRCPWPRTELSAPIPNVPTKSSIQHANEAARIEPTPSGFVNAMQVWPFSPGALYQVYTMTGKVTDIALEPGEEITDISAPDTVRWIIG